MVFAGVQAEVDAAVVSVFFWSEFADLRSFAKESSVREKNVLLIHYFFVHVLLQGTRKSEF